MHSFLVHSWLFQTREDGQLKSCGELRRFSLTCIPVDMVSVMQDSCASQINLLGSAWNLSDFPYSLRKKHEKLIISCPVVGDTHMAPNKCKITASESNWKPLRINPAVRMSSPGNFFAPADLRVSQSHREAMPPPLEGLAKRWVPGCVKAASKAGQKW